MSNRHNFHPRSDPLLAEFCAYISSDGIGSRDCVCWSWLEDARVCFLFRTAMNGRFKKKFDGRGFKIRGGFVSNVLAISSVSFSLIVNSMEGSVYISNCSVNAD